jgi:hypothetical protein
LKVDLSTHAPVVVEEMLKMMHGEPLSETPRIAIIFLMYYLGTILVLPVSYSKILIQRLDDLAVACIPEQDWDEFNALCCIVFHENASKFLRLTCLQKLVNSFENATDDMRNTCMIYLCSAVPSIIVSPDLLEVFVCLPYAAICIWMESDDLKVHSENCVAFLVLAWLVKREVDSDLIVRDLVMRLRVPHLSMFYINNMLPKNLKLHPETELKLLRLTCGDPGISHDWDGYEAWVKPPRESHMEIPLIFCWKITDEEVRGLLNGEHIATGPFYVHGFFVIFRMNLIIAENHVQLEVSMGLDCDKMRWALSPSANIGCWSIYRSFSVFGQDNTSSIAPVDCLSSIRSPESHLSPSAFLNSLKDPPGGKFSVHISNIAVA